MINSPFTLENINFKNRLVMPPMASATSTEEGFVTDKTSAFYTDRAEGGKIGLIITEHSYISMQGKASKNQLSIADDACIEGLSALTDAIHRCGSLCFAQINHAGSAADSKITGFEPVGPSAVPFPRREGTVPPRELSISEIADICDEFAAAALRAKKAGYDGVEIHSAHGYLLNQFYTPLLNKRGDRYGGSLENRLRFHLEVMEAVRGAVGSDYPMALRLGGSDYREGGATLDDCAAAARIFEDAGLDLLDLSGGICGFNVPGRSGTIFRDMAEAVKTKSSLPLVLTGGILTAAQGSELVSSGCAELIGVGRAVLSDKDWARKEMK